MRLEFCISYLFSHNLERNRYIFLGGALPTSVKLNSPGRYLYIQYTALKRRPYMTHKPVLLISEAVTHRHFIYHTVNKKYIIFRLIFFQFFLNYGYNSIKKKQIIACPTETYTGHSSRTWLLSAIPNCTSEILDGPLIPVNFNRCDFWLAVPCPNAEVTKMKRVVPLSISRVVETYPLCTIG